MSSVELQPNHDYSTETAVPARSTLLGDLLRKAYKAHLDLMQYDPYAAAMLVRQQYEIQTYVPSPTLREVSVRIGAGEEVIGSEELSQRYINETSGDPIKRQATNNEEHKGFDILERFNRQLSMDLRRFSGEAHKKKSSWDASQLKGLKKTKESPELLSLLPERQNFNEPWEICDALEGLVVRCLFKHDRYGKPVLDEKGNKIPTRQDEEMLRVAQFLQKKLNAYCDRCIPKAETEKDGKRKKPHPLENWDQTERAQVIRKLIDQYVYHGLEHYRGSE